MLFNQFKCDLFFFWFKVYANVLVLDCVWKEVSLFLNKAYPCIHFFHVKCSSFVRWRRKSSPKMYGHHRNDSKICNIPLFLLLFPFFFFFHYFHCFSFCWLHYCSCTMTWFDGIFHEINAEILWTEKKNWIRRPLFVIRKTFQFFFSRSLSLAFDKLLQKIMINANLDPFEISKRNY